MSGLVALSYTPRQPTKPARWFGAFGFSLLLPFFFYNVSFVTSLTRPPRLISFCGSPTDKPPDTATSPLERCVGRPRSMSHKNKSRIRERLARIDYSCRPWAFVPEEPSWRAALTRNEPWKSRRYQPPVIGVLMPPRLVSGVGGSFFSFRK